MTGASRIVEAGRNCWRVDRASRFSCIQDAAEYFRLVRQAMLAARRTVFLLGWDLTAQTDLLPGGDSSSDAPTRLDRLLRYVARRRPALRCYLLTWDYGSLYTLERDPLTRWRLGWRMPRGVRFGFDDRHPIGGCHHQKVVVVDDQLAFCGGIDLTGHRWDTSAHRVDEPARVTPLGVSYGPYHEIQAMVSGPVAAGLGVLARDRWRALGAKRLPPVLPSTSDLWPDGVPADLTNVDVGIARTMPGSGDHPPVRECEALFLDSVARARRTIYIESQYFTSVTLAEPLAARLREPRGPEVVVVAPQECHGWLEKHTMGAFRDSVFRLLREADLHKRLRLVYPAASRAQNTPTFIHSKVMIVDDDLARIGSANWSERSLGMDTECDVAADAAGQRASQNGIRAIRDRLLAEHLGLPVVEVAGAAARDGSIGSLIDAHAGADHTLVPIEIAVEAEPPSEVLRAAADPAEPIAFGESASLVPAVEATSGGDSLRIWILPAVVLAVGGAVVWFSTAASGPEQAETIRTMLMSLPGASGARWIGIGVFVAAGLLLVPLELLAITAGLTFGGLHGGVVGVAGSLVAAVLGYVAGHLIGPARLPRWITHRSHRSASQVGVRDVKSLVALRLAGVASAGSIHLLCGAGRVPFGKYLAGTTIAHLPTMGVLIALGALVRHTLLYPSVGAATLTAGAALILIALRAGLRTLLLIRQFAPSISGQRGRAEFG